MTQFRWPLLAAAVLTASLSCGAAAAQEAAQPPGEADLDAMIAATETDEGALALARQQVAAGDTTAALATLERSLLLRSSTWADDVRLYYGQLLCQVGDHRRGAYQLSNVRNIAADGWAEARAACGQAPLTTAATRGNGVAGIFTLGVNYETDAVGGLVAQIDTPGFVKTDDGTALVGTAVVNAQFASTLDGHGYAGGALNVREAVAGPDLDYAQAALWLGYAKHLSGADRQLAGGVIARHSLLFDESFLTEYGGQAEYSFADGHSGRWIVAGEAGYREFSDKLASSGRDGPHYEVSLTYRSTPALARVWTAGAALEVQDADLDRYAYTGLRLYGANQIPITSGGSYVGFSGVIRYARFEDAFFYDHETRAYLRAAVGTPLNRDGLFLEGAVTYSGRWYDENAFLYEFQSVGIETRLVYRFGL